MRSFKGGTSWTGLLMACRSLAERVRRHLERSPLTGSGRRHHAETLLLHLEKLEEAVRSCEEVARLQVGSRLAGRRTPSARDVLAEAMRSAFAHITGEGAARPHPGAGQEVEGKPMVFPREIFSPADALQFLSVNKQTGRLVIGGDEETFTIGLEEGDVVSAYSDASPPGQRLGEILVSRGALSKAELEAFLMRHTQDPARIGRMLTSGELVSREEIYAALREQMGNLFGRCFSSRPRRIAFTSGGPESDVDMRLDVSRLIIEGVPAPGSGV